MPPSLEDIVRDGATRAEKAGLSVEQDALGNVSIKFPQGAWETDPEETEVYLQEHETTPFDEEVARLSEQLPDVTRDVLELYAASRHIDFC